MTLKHTGKHINFDEAVKEFKILSHKEVLVGFFGDKDPMLLTIVRANEYGATIKPRNGKFLWIPSKNVPKGFTHQELEKTIGGFFRPKGKNVIVRNEHGKLVTYWYLVEETTIPSRPFIRKAYQNNRKHYQEMIDHGVQKIIAGDMKADQLLDLLGQRAVADIQKSLVSLKNPKNAPVTIENKGSSNPLVNTGELKEKVTYKVIDI